MEGKIDKNGNLIMKRGSEWKNAMCITIPGRVCWDGCRAFEEPFLNNGIVSLQYCKGLTLFDVFTDERE